MKVRHATLVFMSTLALTLTGCSADSTDDTPAATTSSSAEVSTSSATKTSTTEAATSTEPSTPTSAPEPSTTPAPTAEPTQPSSPAAPTPAPQVPAPAFVECIYGGGSWTTNALMSDGSWQWHAECQRLHDEQMAANPYQCPQTDHFVPDPSYCEANRVPQPQQQIPVYQTPAYLLPDSPEEIAGQRWWADCIAENTAGYCRSVDPYVN